MPSSDERLVALEVKVDNLSAEIIGLHNKLDEYTRRPSWAIVITISTLASLSTGAIVALLQHL